jgi:TetR/AcrR family transcriptional regulator, regulator of autoinduction and epiphytic fitness
VHDVVIAADEAGATLRENGRSERARRTRAAIVEAHLELLAQGELRATAQQVADRSGVSVRTLWMHFADMEAVFAATAEAVLREQVSSYREIRTDLALEQRIDRFCRQRARLMEKLSPYARASQLREPLSPVLQGYRARHVEQVAAEVERLFAADLAENRRERREQVHALAAASTWGTWSVLRQHLGLGTASARRVMARTVTALLRAPDGTRATPPPAEEPA